MLASLTVRSVRLLTNNPKKVASLEAHGIRVAGRLPHVIAASQHNRFYLETKAKRSGHLIELQTGAELSEQDDPAIPADALDGAGNER
jgi:GTP cyclohydrolase II